MSLGVKWSAQGAFFLAVQAAVQACTCGLPSDSLAC
jgi:hypothetical protein